MKNKNEKEQENTIFGSIAFVAIIVMMFTMGLFELEEIPEWGFWICILVQMGVFVYCVYRCRAFIWQKQEKEDKK